MSSDPSGAFQTHSAYLEAFSRLASGWENALPAAYKDLKRRFVTASRRPAASKLSNPEVVKKCLENAWSTEFLLCLGHRFTGADEVVRLSNNWNVVQAYYSLYHGTQAVVVARGSLRPESHPKTQTLFLDVWCDKPGHIEPWCLWAGSGCYGSLGIEIDEDVHPWRRITPATAMSIACKALRTTRDDALPDAMRSKREEKRRLARRTWKEEENIRVGSGKRPRKEPSVSLPQLTPLEKKAIMDKVRRYSLLDYLYRLRIRTNYVDSAMFTDGPTADGQATKVRSSILRLVGLSLYLAELEIASIPGGRTAIESWANSWTKTNVPGGFRIGIGERLNLWRA
jgi:hypothetical protein